MCAIWHDRFIWTWLIDMPALLLLLPMLAILASCFGLLDNMEFSDNLRCL